MIQTHGSSQGVANRGGGCIDETIFSGVPLKALKDFLHYRKTFSKLQHKRTVTITLGRKGVQPVRHSCLSRLWLEHLHAVVHHPGDHQDLRHEDLVVLELDADHGHPG